MVTETEKYYCPKCGFPMEEGVCRKCAQDSYSVEEEEAWKKVKRAVIVGAISFVVTAVFALTEILGPWTESIIDLVLIAGLTLGVLFRNRVCAVLLFIYWIISKLIMLTMGLSGWLGLPIGILFGFFFYGAIPGTFTLHRIKQEKIARQRKTYTRV